MSVRGLGMCDSPWMTVHLDGVNVCRKMLKSNADFMQWHFTTV